MPITSNIPIPSASTNTNTNTNTNKQTSSITGTNSRNKYNISIVTSIPKNAIPLRNARSSMSIKLEKERELKEKQMIERRKFEIETIHSKNIIKTGPAGAHIKKVSYRKPMPNSGKYIYIYIYIERQDKTRNKVDIDSLESMHSLILTF